MSKLNPIGQAVSEYLDSINVRCTCVHIRATQRDDWKCDQWEFVLKGKTSVPFDYFTGMGHRMPSRHLRAGKPVTPHVAGLISSLILDSGASTQSFISWCNDFGCDADSQKALATYLACQENAIRFNTVFTSEQQDRLAELLQDY